MKNILFIIFNIIFTNFIYSQTIDPSDYKKDKWPLDSFSNNEYNFYQELKIFQDKSGIVSFSEVKKNHQLFIENSTIEHYQPSETYWAKLNLQGASQKTDDYLFHFSMDNWEKSWENIEVWLVHENGEIDFQKTGNALNRSSKSVPSTMNLAQFKILQNEKVTLYARLSGIASTQRKIPDHISFFLLKKELYPGYVEGYPFRNKFLYSKSWSPFRANMIVTHELFVDKTKEKTIDDIYGNWNKLERKSLLDMPHEMGKVYWMKVRLYGNTYFNGEQILHISSRPGRDESSFNYIDVYTFDGSGKYQHQRTGDHIPMKDRPFNFWANFIKLDIEPNDTLDVFIRMEGSDKRFLMRNIAIYHIDRTSVFPRQVDAGVKHGLFYGILGIQCLYFLLLFFIERESIHLYFTFFAFGLFLTLGFIDDSFSKFVIFPSWRDYHINLFYFGFYLSQVGLLKFTESYFLYPKKSIFSKWIVPIFLFISAIVSLNANYKIEYDNGSEPFTELYYLLAIIFPILSILIALIMAFVAPPQKNVSKFFFYVAFLPLFLIMLMILGRISAYALGLDSLAENPNYIITYNTIKLSIIAMLTLLALSTGYRTNRLKEDKETALQKNLSDQRRINKAISRFVPNEFLRALNKSSITEVGLGDNIEKEVTVFFSDIRNYTSLSEKLTPEENFQFVNAYNGRMGPIIQKNKGFVNQYLGDGIMAIFPNSADDALNAAIQMQHMIQTYNEQRIKKNKSPIAVGMGMHTGSLIMGITGDDNRLDATTISDSVNSASRIEGLSKYYGASILMSEVSLKKINKLEAFHFRYLGKVQVKGKQKPLKIYECFDGDDSDNFDLKLKTLAPFNLGIQNYFTQMFDQAILNFESVIQENPKDKTAKLFLYKARQLNKMGVAEDWTGVELMEKK